MSVFEVAGLVTARQAAERAGIQMRPRGRRAWARCPIHGERTASMMFDEAGKWHCFGCNSGGDSIDLYAALYGLSLLDAARRLAEEFGIGIDDAAPTDAERRAWAEQRRAREEADRQRAEAYNALYWAEAYMRDQCPETPAQMNPAHARLLVIHAEVSALLDGAPRTEIPDWGWEVVERVRAIRKVLDGIGQPMLGNNQRCG